MTSDATDRPQERSRTTSPTASVSSCAVAVDVAALAIEDGRLTVLLVEPDDATLAGTWSLPGRRVRDDESLDATALRALGELAGVRGPTVLLEQLRTYGEPARDPHARVVSVAYLALAPRPLVATGERRTTVISAVEAATWPADRFAYDHAAIVPDALERLRAKLEYTSLATALLEQPFTLGELRAVYEAVWDVDLDPANFRRKVVSTPGFVRAVGGTAPSGPSGGRPARRYHGGGATRLHPAMLRDR
jgi:8-oxo-dGTP diphosphatase